MTSYIKLYEDFLQKKESSVKAVSLPEDDDNEDAQSDSLADNTANNSKMEHSYTRDKSRPAGEMSTGLAPARTILVRRPPQCPSCHTHPMEEHDQEDANQAAIPSINEIAAKESMNECARIAKYVKNNNPDDDDWESRVNQTGWTTTQKTLFTTTAQILDNDQLGRLANAGRLSEAMQRRVVVDKSAARMRKALATVSWEPRLTQWLHGLLMDSLPSTYMASYLDILQTLKSKLPSLMDKMLFGRPLNISQELLAPVMKKQWGPSVINTKPRKLAQNAVIVALPSMPASGPVPIRLQKWYQQLATITQIVQITLPTTSSLIMRTPLEQVAEQIVSLTRVKIQELRSENSTRSIILIGFNAGAALALQVAISENIACVVCMGFAYNTFNGTRGAPDDRMLDIKVPILFVIGQNSARSSPEEIESLREKMQSETSLVIVGSADDVLRVPKSRRKIENVTQSMVDTMVVDEVYEFIKKTLNNPPGPRIPTAISSAIYSKSKATVSSAGADGKTSATPTPRKRKQDASDSDQTPAKTKYVPHIGRPRTRPYPTTAASAATKGATTATPVGGGKQQKTQIASITNEDLNNAIQSILGDNPEDSPANSSGDSPQKLVTNFELVAQTKSTPIKTSLINPLQKVVTSTNISGSTTTTTNIGGATGTKIKMIPANQFVQLKPSLQSQSKIYTIKTTAMQAATSATNIGSIVTTTPAATATAQQQIFTLKSPNGQTTQFVTAAPATAQQKYTVVKNATGGTTVQLTTPKSAGSGSGSLDLSNIIDMPIIFADSDGNLSDTVAAEAGGSSKVSTYKTSTSSSVGQLIISQKIIKEATTTTSKSGSGTYVIGKASGTTIMQQQQQTISAQPVGSKPNKVVFINRNTMKPCPNIISRSNMAQQLPKYTKVVVTNPKTAATTLVPRAANTQITISGSSASGAVSTMATPIVSTVKQVNLQALNNNTVSVSSSGTSPSVVRPGGILNMANKSFQIINAGSANSANVVSGGAAGSDKPQIRNIVVKPGGLKQIPPHLKTQLLNRNLTVRKLVNIVPVSKTSSAASVTITAATSDAAQDNASPTSSGGSPTTTAIQSTPKIITLNPINRTPQSKAD